METNEAATANEPVAARGTNSYADVMSFLHAMTMSPAVKEKVGRRLVQEVTEIHLAEAFARLDHLTTLEDGWAGDGSYAVSRKVLSNVKSVLSISNNKDWKEWMISPDVNATLGLQSRTKTALISIGNTEFSYYSNYDGKIMRASHVPFSPQALLDVMRKIE